MIKLHEWSIHGNLPIILDIYMKDRTFQVRVLENIYNEYLLEKRLENGILQGSPLSVTCLQSSSKNDASRYTRSQQKRLRQCSSNRIC